MFQVIGFRCVEVIMLYTETFNCAKDLLDENPPRPPFRKGGRSNPPKSPFRKRGPGWVPMHIKLWNIYYQMVIDFTIYMQMVKDLSLKIDKIP